MSREIISPEAGEVSGTQLPMDGSTHAQLWRIAFLPWELLASGKLGNSWRASLKVYGLTYSRFTHRGCMVHSFFFFFQLILKKAKQNKTKHYVISSACCRNLPSRRLRWTMPMVWLLFRVFVAVPRFSREIVCLFSRSPISNGIH